MLLTVAAALVLSSTLALAEEVGQTVQVKKWKVDPVELYDKPDGAVAATKPASELPGEAVRAGNGWLEVSVGGQQYYVDASQARTDLKLTGKPKCDTLAGATGYAASRGLAQDCEP
jgi:hypothetical protein